VRLLCSILICFLGFPLFADEVIPPAPKSYFNDYAGVVSVATAAELNQTLENFERQSSDQIVVAIFPKMQSDSSIEDYTVRVARSWKAGQKDKNNGVVLFVFVQDHKMFLQVGYGLEGALPDATCKRIIDEEISPRFKAGDFDGGLTSGVRAIIASVKGEYTGTGTTVAGRRVYSRDSVFAPLAILFLLFILIVFMRGGRFFSGYSCWTIGSGGFSGGGGSGSGGFSGGFGGGGGGFSGGGGSFGGGGAGGGW